MGYLDEKGLTYFYENLMRILDGPSPAEKVPNTLGFAKLRANMTEDLKEIRFEVVNTLPDGDVVIETSAQTLKVQCAVKTKFPSDSSYFFCGKEFQNLKRLDLRKSDISEVTNAKNAFKDLDPDIEILLPRPLSIEEKRHVNYPIPKKS